MALSQDFLSKYGPYALVTGASSGIGEECCRQLAKAGFSLVITARRASRLENLSEELQNAHRKIAVHIIVADLSKAEDVERVIDETADIDIGLLINSAGMEQLGSFFVDDIQRHEQLVNLNVMAPMKLVYSIGERMIKRKKGGIINVSSIMSFPAPYCTTYSASKAFVTAFSKMLAYEMKPHGVDVLCMEPGVVITEMTTRFSQIADVPSLGMPKMDCETAIQLTLPQLGQRPHYVPGLLNQIMVYAMKWIPESVLLSMMGSQFERIMRTDKMLARS